MKMNKFMTALAAMTIATTTFAGGLMTNTNQSASFLRSVARGTTYNADAVYFNPAGTAFMGNGFHIAIGNQIARQTRTISSTYAPFAMGASNNGLTTKDFTGKAFAPFIPSLQVTYKHNNWAVMAGVGVNGGGGSLEFANGLGSFERQFSVLPGALTNAGVPTTQYDMNMYLKGSSMTLAFNVGASYKITEWLSAAALVRFSPTNNSYTGHIKDIKINPSGAMMSASTYFASARDLYAQQAAQLAAAYGSDHPYVAKAMAAATEMGTYAVLTSDHTLEVEQKGFAISPILALAFHKGNWDASVKYEFEMGTELKIKSAEVSANDPVINSIFADGSTVKSETPALLSAAVSRQCGPVKVTAEWHHFFDKNAENSFSPAVKGNTNEYLFGAEWAISDRWLVSAGAQRTQLNLDENAYSDMNFSLSAWSFGVGFEYKITDYMNFNFGYMPTLYDTATAKGVASGVDFKDVYSRTSNAIGIGLDFTF